MTKRIVSLVLAVAMVLTMGIAFAAEGDTQVMNLRVSAFGNNYDVQDMGWRWMMGDCYEGLYRNVADEAGEHFILAGAESMDVSADGLEYTFNLRQNAKWSDGVPVTAADYVYGWTRLLDHQYGYDYASFIWNVVGAEEYNKGEGKLEDVAITADGDYIFKVTLKVADPTFVSKLVATPLYPTRQDLAEAAGDQWGKDWKLCVYNGPFCMSELVEDNKMVWTKNPYYWNVAETGLDAVNWYLVAQDSTASTMFDKGELDVLQTSGDYLVKYRGQAADGKVNLWSSDYPGTVGFFFNFATGGTNGMMKNVNIRKALSYAIDREDIIDAVYGRYNPSYGWVNPAILINNQPYRSLVEDPAYAEAMTYLGDDAALQALFQQGLAELGLDTDLSKVTVTLLTYGSTLENNNEREYLQQTWEEVLGIKVNLNTVGDYSLFTAERNEGNFDLMSGGWYSDYNDPMDFLYTMYTGIYASYGSYSNPEYDALLDSLTGENDNDVRLAVYAQAEKMLFDDCALIPIYYATKDYFYQPWVKDYHTSSFGASQELYVTKIDGRGN